MLRCRKAIFSHENDQYNMLIEYRDGLMFHNIDFILTGSMGLPHNTGISAASAWLHLFYVYREAAKHN